MLRSSHTSLWACVLLLVTFDHGKASNQPNKNLERKATYWKYHARKTLQDTISRSMPNTNIAKNVIIFIGDGMDLSTITAGRIWKGQREGMSGEEYKTAMEQFSHIGLSKIYTLDSQTPDSAGTATAILTGVKTKSKMIGLSGKAEHENCSSVAGNEVKTVLEEFAELGKSTGIVTTAHVVHATPSSAYAHTPSRSWTSDSGLPEEAKKSGCKDIALQLIEKGRDINVILGGGRVFMRPIGYEDEEYGSEHSKSKYGRLDERNLIKEWINLNPSDNARYVWNKTEFDSIDPQKVDNLMGLFEPYYMHYDHERETDVGGEPSIAEMTSKAISILRRNKKGYFLLVEAGKIDSAHHQTMANKALSEFAALDEAVKVADTMTNERDTLIIVTGDHGHMFTVGGTAVRGNPITGLAHNHDNPSKARDGKRYPSIVYGNGFEWQGDATSTRKDPSGDVTMDMEFRFPSAIPLGSETHSSSDIPVMARGPMSHLFSGVYEQNYIAYAAMYASCSGSDKRHCTMERELEYWSCDKTQKTTIASIKKRFPARYSAPRRKEPWWCSSHSTSTNQRQPKMMKPALRGPHNVRPTNRSPKRAVVKSIPQHSKRVPSASKPTNPPITRSKPTVREANTRQPINHKKPANNRRPTIRPTLRANTNTKKPIPRRHLSTTKKTFPRRRPATSAPRIQKPHTARQKRPVAQSDGRNGQARPNRQQNKPVRSQAGNRPAAQSSQQRRGKRSIKTDQPNGVNKFKESLIPDEKKSVGQGQREDLMCTDYVAKTFALRLGHFNVPITMMLAVLSISTVLLISLSIVLLVLLRKKAQMLKSVMGEYTKLTTNTN